MEDKRERLRVSFNGVVGHEMGFTDKWTDEGNEYWRTHMIKGQLIGKATKRWREGDRSMKGSKHIWGWR